MVFFHEQYIACKEDLLMQRYQSCRDIPCDNIWIFTSGIDFTCWNVLATYLLWHFNILDCHWTVLDLVDANHLLVVLRWRIDEGGIEVPSNFRTLYLSCCETLFFIRDCVDKSELLIPWFKVIQTTIMNSELHVWFPFILSTDDKHHLIAPVGNQVLEAQVVQCYNIGDGIFAEPHIVVVAVHRCLMGHCNCAAIGY